MKPSLLILLAFLLILGFSHAIADEGGDTFFIFDTPNLTSAGGGDDANIYLSPDGNDAAPGTMDSPLQSLSEAFLRIYQSSSTDVVTIWLRGGTYYLDRTLILPGELGKEVNIRNYPGETPILTGALEVRDWTESDSHGQRIWSYPLHADEIRAVYGVEGLRQNARWPKTGSLTVARATSEAANKFEPMRSFYVNPGELPGSLNGAIVRLVHWWKDELSGVFGYDPSTGIIQMNRPTAMSISAGEEFWLENVSGVPLAQGEWLYDAYAGTLYYAPYDYEAIGETPLYVGLAEELFIFNGVSNLRFDGIVFTRTGWSIPNHDQTADFPQAAYDALAAIYVANGRNITFANCTFQDIGSGCIRLDASVQNATIFNCTFADIGAQAIYIHGYNNSLSGIVTEDIVIENNEIHGYGRNFYNAAAILVIHARDIDIAYNEIYDGTYTAISAGWVWGDDYSVTNNIRVRNNSIYNIGQGLLSDLGAIYMLGSQPNSIISGNVIHDVTMAEYGGWGIYLDEGSSGITVVNNLVYRCSAQGFHQHNAGSNTVDNNIFAFNGDGQVGISGSGSFILSHNIVVGNKPYLNIVNTGTIKNRNNLFRANGDIFIDAAQDNYNLRDTSDYKEIEFIPWVFVAGRYATE